MAQASLIRPIYSTMKELSFHIHGSPSPSFSGSLPGSMGTLWDEEDLQELRSALEVYWSLPRPFTSKRHVERIEAYKALTPTWRMKERMKTVSVALVLCLNVGVDPPDVVKIYPCARQECWMDPMLYTDPLSTNNVKAVEAIGTALQHQYERWQPRARYKLSLDPTLEELKKLCLSLRRNAKDERVLFHYNGHGVPKPTKNGEIWVFNKQFTQYIPLSVVDLHHWMGTPSIYVYDCSNAGHVINYIKLNQALLIAASASNAAAAAAAASTTSHQVSPLTSSSGSSASEVSNAITAAVNDKPGSDNPMNNLIILAACGEHEILPMNAELPADLFTACLTTPMQIALKWFILQKTSLLVRIDSLDLLDKIPGQMNDRRTMIGELNWIFTAITDTIAWNLLSKELFQKLFRQDLLVASLFRNFLLAERIMRSYNCTPVSLPRLPSTFQHPMWQAWDMTLDHCLAQLPAVKDNPNAYNHSSFFAEQLTAFQVWLSYGSERRNPPEQLPIVLQVLLSQVHRQRALELLGRFLDLGPWAVNLALSVGIFPYVLKLLQSSARDLRPLLVFIWAKLLAVDTSCQADLVKDNGHKYFLSVLSDPYMPAEHRTMAAFVLTIIVDNYPNGQEVALQGNLIAICLEQLADDHALLRQWCALCLGKVWTKYDDARWCGVRDSAHMKLAELLIDPVPEVRASTVYALGTFVNNTTPERSEQVNTIDHAVAVTLLPVLQDASPLVRKELIVSLSHYVSQFESQFVAAAVQLSEEDTARGYHTVAGPVGGLGISNDTSVLHGSGFGANVIKRSVSTRSLKGTVVPLATMGAAAADGLGSVDQSGTAHTISPSGTGGSMRRVATHNSSLLAGGHGTIYSNVWRVIQQLCLDAVPGVSELAKKLSAHIRNKPMPMKPALAQVQQVHHRKLSMPVPTVVLSSSPHSAPGSPSNKPISFLAPRQSPGNQHGAELSGIPESERSGARRRTEHADTLPRIGSGSSVASRLGLRSRVSGSEKLSISADTSTDKPSVDGKPLILRTELFAWCCRYFSEPLIHNVGIALGVNKGQQGDDNDPEGAQHQEREYRFMCAERAQRQAERERKSNRKAKFDETAFSSRLVSNPVSVRFHPYTNLLAVADHDVVSIWDWEHGTRINTFSNRNQRHSRITCVEFINIHDQGLLLTGSNDGLVKIYRGFVPQESNVNSSTSHHPTLVSAWPALTDMVPVSKGSGMVLTYDNTSAILFNSGDVRHITQWDLTKELKVMDLPTGADSSVTSLTLDPDSSSVIVAGCGDSTVRIYDVRMSASSCNVLTYSDHKSWVVSAKTLHTYPHLVISASSSGDLNVWDRRTSKTLTRIDTGGTISCLDAHQYADVIACGSVQQWINIYGHNGEILNSIKFHEGFMASKIGQVSCLAFHPLKMKLATGHLDQSISVYSSTPTEGRRR